MLCVTFGHTEPRLASLGRKARPKPPISFNSRLNLVSVHCYCQNHPALPGGEAPTHKKLKIIKNIRIFSYVWLLVTQNPTRLRRAGKPARRHHPASPGGEAYQPPTSQNFASCARLPTEITRQKIGARRAPPEKNRGFFSSAELPAQSSLRKAPGGGVRRRLRSRTGGAAS